MRSLGCFITVLLHWGCKGLGFGCCDFLPFPIVQIELNRVPKYDFHYPLMSSSIDRNSVDAIVLNNFRINCLHFLSQKDLVSVMNISYL